MQNQATGFVREPGPLRIAISMTVSTTKPGDTLAGHCHSVARLMVYCTVMVYTCV